MKYKIGDYLKHLPANPIRLEYAPVYYGQVIEVGSHTYKVKWIYSTTAAESLGATQIVEAHIEDFDKSVNIKQVTAAEYLLFTPTKVYDVLS